MKLFKFIWLPAWAAASLGVSFPVFGEESPGEFQPPSCETLNALWPTYHAHFKLRFSRAEHFDCPSDTSKLAETFYLLQHTRS